MRSGGGPSPNVKDVGGDSRQEANCQSVGTSYGSLFDETGDRSGRKNVIGSLQNIMIGPIAG